MALYLRKAVQEDMDLLYRWVNDSEVRKNAFHTGEIAYDTYKTWCAKVMKEKDIQQYILVKETEGIQKIIGQIRLNINKDTARIDYSIARNMRKRGYGVKIVKKLEEMLTENENGIVVLVAEVKNENIASAKVFQKCGYTETQKNNYIEFRKQIK